MSEEKKDGELALIGEANLVPFEIPDLNLPSLMDIRGSFLEVKDTISERGVAVLGMRALGFSFKEIAWRLEISPSNARDYAKRYDPNGLCDITADDRKLITSKMLMTAGISALMEITGEKLKELPADRLASVAAKCVATAERMAMVKKVEEIDKATKLSAMMDMLDYAEEAE